MFIFGKMSSSGALFTTFHRFYIILTNTQTQWVLIAGLAESVVLGGFDIDIQNGVKRFQPDSDEILL